jgi:ABC-type multidrug transport system ATPase subunit
MKEIISASGLTKSYNQVKALDGLDISINEGDFFGFLGPNGAGKTTTIRLLTGIIKPDSGKITIDGFSPDQKGKVAGIIGVVPESRGFYDWMRAEEYLRFFAALYGIKGSDQAEKVKSLLEQVDLSNDRKKRIGAFSRGMKQRLGLARALLNSPRILFLDEPTLGLDPQGQEDIENLLRNLNRQGVTIFYSSHLLHEVSELCSRIAIINKGKLIAQGTMQELQKKTNLNEAYLIKIEGNLEDLEPTPYLSGIDQVKTHESASEFVFQGSLEDANGLLSLLREKNMKILEFHSQTEALTDVFLNLVAGA